MRQYLVVLWLMMNWIKNGDGKNSVTVTVSDRRTLFDDLSRRFDAKEGFSVATLNLDHAVKLPHDPAFRAAYCEHTHVTADGNPVVWLSRLAGQKDVKLVPGSELIEPLAEIAARKGVPVGLFGATESSLRAAADALQQRHPTLQIAYVKAPAMGFDPEGDEAGKAISEIGASGARIVFLALGAPKQERFAARAQRSLNEVGFLSIGAGLDFISGAQQRAPKIVRAFALEWLWRLFGNPRRLIRRYGACILALPALTLRALASRHKERV